MNKSQNTTLPYPVIRTLKKLGQDIAIARRARRISQADLAVRVDASISTIKRIEEGYPGTALHTFLRVLHILGKLDAIHDLLALEKDALGLDLVQEQLPKRIRSQKRRAPISGQANVGDDNDELEGF